MDPLSITLGVMILLVFAAIVVRGVLNHKRGKGGCSCGGSCAGCGLCGKPTKPPK